MPPILRRVTDSCRWMRCRIRACSWALLRYPETAAPRPDLFQLPCWEIEDRPLLRDIEVLATGDSSRVSWKVFVLMMLTIL